MLAKLLKFLHLMPVAARIFFVMILATMAGALLGDGFGLIKHGGIGAIVGVAGGIFLLVRYRSVLLD